MDPRTVLHWYDFNCPLSYVGQQRTAILVRHGLAVVALPFQAHPEIPMEGIEAGPRYAPMYAMLEREAKAAGLPLRWPARLPNTRRALAAAEWVRRHQPAAFPQMHRDLFAAHFALGEDLGDPAVIDGLAKQAGVEMDALHADLDGPAAEEAVVESESLGRGHGVQRTPAWLISRQLISALRPASDFERMARLAAEA
ncbi:MAG: DsbA family protein [Bryobacteraceae bacterium]|jgi:2-hydroxychromene-2-carboxylate isomerase